MENLPPEAWDLIFKSGNAGVIILGVIAWKLLERVSGLSERVAVLEALRETEK